MRVIAKEQPDGTTTLALAGNYKWEVFVKYFAFLAAAIASGVILAKAVKTYAA